MPISSDHVIRADVPTTHERLQRGSRKFREQSGAFIGNVRIVLGVEHQHLGTFDFPPAVPKIVERTATKLVPACIREPICVPERLTDVLSVVRVRGLGLLSRIQNAPVHNRAIRDHPFHSWVKRQQDCRSTAETAANHEDLIWCKLETLTERNFFQFLWQFIEHIEDVFMG